MSCGCGEQKENRGSDFRITMTALRQLQDAASRGGHRAEPSDKVHLVDLYGKPAVHIQKDDKNHFFIVSRFGSIFGLSVKITKFKLDFPKLDMQIEASFAPLDDGPFKVTVTIDIHCDDIGNPVGCTIKINDSQTDKEISPLIDWDCLKRCAPQCIRCGTDLGCWARCAAGCVFQCL
jgi:hypothetical protein